MVLDLWDLFLGCLVGFFYEGVYLFFLRQETNEIGKGEY